MWIGAAFRMAGQLLQTDFNYANRSRLLLFTFLLVPVSPLSVVQRSSSAVLLVIFA